MHVGGGLRKKERRRLSGWPTEKKKVPNGQSTGFANRKPQGKRGKNTVENSAVQGGSLGTKPEPPLTYHKKNTHRGTDAKRIKGRPTRGPSSGTDECQ